MEEYMLPHNKDARLELASYKNFKVLLERETGSGDWAGSSYQAGSVQAS
jgi:hypothetical protein